MNQVRRAEFDAAISALAPEEDPTEERKVIQPPKGVLAGRAKGANRVS